MWRLGRFVANETNGLSGRFSLLAWCEVFATRGSQIAIASRMGLCTASRALKQPAGFLARGSCYFAECSGASAKPE
jgi:hypothetical protein